MLYDGQESFCSNLPWVVYFHGVHLSSFGVGLYASLYSMLWGVGGGSKPLFESLSLSSHPSQDYFNLTMGWLLTCQFTWDHSSWAHAEFYHFLGHWKCLLRYGSLPMVFGFMANKYFQSVAMWASKDFPQSWEN